MYPAIDAGEFDQEIIFRSRTTAKSASGADIPQSPPVDVATCRASIKISGGRPEFFSADQLATQIRYLIKTYYISGITEEMEIYWQARDVTLDIVQVLDVGTRPRTLQVFAEERR